MKKLYTFLSAVICSAAIVSAANPFNASTVVSTGSGNVSVASAPSLKISERALEAYSSAWKQAPSKIKDPNAPNVVGEYILMYQDNPTVDVECTNSSITNENGKDYLNGFIYSDANPLPGVVSKKSFQVSETETKMLYAFTIKGGGTVPFYTANDKTPMLYFFFYTQEGKPAVDSKADLDFLIMPDGSLIWPYTDCGVAWLTPDMYGSWVINTNLMKANGTMDGGYYEYDEATDTEKVTPQTTPIYAEYDPEVGLVISGFLGSNKILRYVIDEASKTAIGENVVAFTYYDQQSKKSYDFSVITDLENAAAKPVFNILSSKADKSVISAPYMALYNAELGGAGIWIEPTVSVPFQITTNEIEASGVENVTVSNSNAPVEYFNLQGVRVANPAAGELVIKRQGATVSKMVVR